LTDHFKTAASPQRHSKGTYSLVSLGCPKNLVDSERMLGLLQLDGYQFVSEPEGADFVIVNTCGFIADAREESYAAIDEMLELKRQQRVRGVLVTGCLAERQRESLVAARPEIDHVLGVFARDEVTRVADRLIGGLLGLGDVVLTGHPARRLPFHASFCITGVEGEAVLLGLDVKGIAASSGSACTSGTLEPSHVLLAMGYPHEIAHGSLRLSLSRYTTEEEIDRALEVLPPIIQRLRDMSPLYAEAMKQDRSRQNE